nr:MAG TPA: hypothetical protein [Caudoviricetes sp.]
MRAFRSQDGKTGTGCWAVCRPLKKWCRRCLRLLHPKKRLSRRDDLSQIKQYPSLLQRNR